MSQPYNEDAVSRRILQAGRDYIDGLKAKLQDAIEIGDEAEAKDVRWKIRKSRQEIQTLVAWENEQGGA